MFWIISAVSLLPLTNNKYLYIVRALYYKMIALRVFRTIKNSNVYTRGKAFTKTMASLTWDGGGPAQQCIGDHGRGRVCVGHSVLTVQLVTMTYRGTFGLIWFLWLCVACVRSDLDEEEEKGEYGVRGGPLFSESARSRKIARRDRFNFLILSVFQSPLSFTYSYLYLYIYLYLFCILCSPCPVSLSCIVSLNPIFYLCNFDSVHSTNIKATFIISRRFYNKRTFTFYKKKISPRWCSLSSCWFGPLVWCVAASW